MGIGYKIRELRLRRGITQEILAAKIGVTPSAVGNYERGVSFPKEDVLMRLFGALQCTPNELLGEDALSVGAEYSHLNKYRELDEPGRERVDECTERELRRVLAEKEKSEEFEEVPIAARNGSAEIIKFKKRLGKSVFDLPDYRGGRR